MRLGFNRQERSDMSNEINYGSRLGPVLQDANAGIAVREVSKSFEGGKIRVLQEATLYLSGGQTAALWGASGSGKTTLLNMIGGLDVPDRGHIRTMGRDPSVEAERTVLRREVVGFVFQLHHLIPYLTVRENMLIPAIARGMAGAKASARLAELLEALGLEHRQHQRMQDLSGGERQRVAIGRALFNRPKVLLADEPTGALDERTGEQVFGLMKELAKREGMTLIMATHERRFAESCDRIFHVREGYVREINDRV
jgi:ABC-type lipoprotein export system ATPase subunit